MPCAARIRWAVASIDTIETWCEPEFALGQPLSRARTSALASLIAGLAALSCSSPPAACITGEERPCSCPTGASGSQLCRADGTLDRCECVAPSDSGVADATAEDAAVPEDSGRADAGSGPDAGSDDDAGLPDAIDAGLMDSGFDAGVSLPDAGVDSCAPVTETCNRADDDCDGVVDNGAAASCSLPHARPECLIGICEIAACDVGHDDCNGTAADGCETETQTDATNCGLCGRRCPARPNSIPSCASGTCSAECMLSFGDCDAVASNGCETPLRSALNCGACGRSCRPIRGLGSCATGTCVVTMCDPGFGDCDADGFTGCEADFASDARNCGGCGVACRPGAYCDAGRCRDDVTNLTLGDGHACVLVASGNVFCWGYNGWGQLGDGTYVNRLSPEQVPGLSGVVAIRAGSRMTCALRSDGAVLCWGAGDCGVGDGTTAMRPSPTLVTTVAGGAVVEAGGQHACATSASGSLHCWGCNLQGQVGDGTTTSAPTPIEVLSGITTQDVVASIDHTCSLHPGGRVRCWGAGRRVGDGTGMMRAVPTLLTRPSDAIQISASGGHTCALRIGGTAECWGENSSGQVGDGTTFTLRLSPTPVMGLSGATALAAGGAHTCALTTGGQVRCWGYNISGQLGDGTTTSRSSPVTVPALTGAVRIDAGGFSTCVLSPDGRVLCWGSNVWGQLGDGTMSNRTSPTPVLGLPFL